jgi:hypothetical protein
MLNFNVDVLPVLKLALCVVLAGCFVGVARLAGVVREAVLVCVVGGFFVGVPPCGVGGPEIRVGVEFAGVIWYGVWLVVVAVYVDGVVPEL